MNNIVDNVNLNRSVARSLQSPLCEAGQVSWFVVRSKPNFERVAVAALKSQGFETFFPVVEVPKTEGKCQITPLFPGYIFVRRASVINNWSCVKNLPGISEMVKFGGEVAHVSDKVITRVMNMVKSINVDGGLWLRFKSGETVSINSGKIDSLAVVVDAPKSPESRVRVMFEFLGRQVFADVNREIIQRVDKDLVTGRPSSIIKFRRTRGKGRWIRGFGPKKVLSNV